MEVQTKVKLVIVAWISTFALTMLALAAVANAQTDPCAPDPSSCSIVEIQSANPILSPSAPTDKPWITVDICPIVDVASCVAGRQVISNVPFHSPVKVVIDDLGLGGDCPKQAALGFGCTDAQKKAYEESK